MHVWIQVGLAVTCQRCTCRNVGATDRTQRRTCAHCRRHLPHTPERPCCQRPHGHHAIAGLVSCHNAFMNSRELWWRRQKVPSARRSGYTRVYHCRRPNLAGIYVSVHTHMVRVVTVLYRIARARGVQDNTVTLRHRDSTQQQRVSIETILEGEADAVLRGFFEENHLW